MGSTTSRQHAIVSGLMAVDHRIDLPADEYLRICRARELLIEALVVEETFAIAWRDYEDFVRFIEAELLSKLARNKPDDWTAAMDRLFEVNRRLVHLLGTSTAYLETTNKTLSRLFKKGDDIAASFAKRKDKNTKSPGEGMLWHALRGHTFHRGIPSPALNFNSTLASDLGDPNIRIAHRVDVQIEQSSVRCRQITDDDRDVLIALAAERDAGTLAHSQMQAITAIHDDLTEQLRPRIEEATEIMREAIHRFAELGSSTELHPKLVSFIETVKPLEEIHLSMQWSDRYAAIRARRPTLLAALQPIEVTKATSYKAAGTDSSNPSDVI